MSDAIERELEDEFPMPVAPPKKKRVLSAKQKENNRINLEKGRQKLKEINNQKLVEKGLMLEEKVAKTVARKTAEEKKIELAMEALSVLRNSKKEEPEEETEYHSPPPAPKKQQYRKKPVEDIETETEVEEVIVKKTKPKKKTIVYLDNETDTEYEQEAKPKRSYRKSVAKKQTNEVISTQQTPPQTPVQNIVFY